MKLRSRVVTFGAVLAITASGLLVAGCGGDDEAGSGGTTTTETTSDTSTATTGTSTSGTTSTVVVVKINVITESLQKDLTKLGFYSGAINGQFDAATVAAVKAFQKSVGLAADGVAGPQTHAAIDFELGRRDSGAVRVLQQALTDICLYSGPANGVYTSATEAAVLEFQREQGLGEDGQFGPQTAKALIAAHANRPSSCASKTPKPAATATTGGQTPSATMTVAGRTYGPKTFEVTSCTPSGETGMALKATAAGGYALTVNATNGTGTITIRGGDEQDGIALDGTVNRLQVGDAGDVRGGGTFSEASIGEPNATFTLVGRCA